LSSAFAISLFFRLLTPDATIDDLQVTHRWAERTGSPSRNDFRLATEGANMRTWFFTLMTILLGIAVASTGRATRQDSLASSLPPLPPLHSAALQHPLGLDESKALFERLKRLQGRWRGRSTKGWTDQESIQVIAGGSAILFDSFDAHPNETMVTLIHLDGDRLLLTHYCVAGNQPRLQATAISRDGAQATFSFLDGTNLPSRDTGHMDSLKLLLHDDSHFTKQWSWYQKGAEQWMEQIYLERLSDVPARGR
jgi:hypothetical protein